MILQVNDPTAPPGPAQPRPADAFQSESLVVSTRLRAALARLIGDVPGGVRSGSDFARRLNLGSTLAWQMYSFCEAHSPFDALGQLPGRPSFERVIECARKKGVKAEILQNVERAFEELEDLIDRHAGDRPTFSSMISALTTQGAAQIDFDAKRDAYRALAHIYGVQRDVALSCSMIHAGTTPGRLTHVNVEGSVGLRIMKPIERLCLSRRGYESDEPGHKRVRLEPIEKDDVDGVPVIRPFCSEPMPSFRRQVDPAGYMEFYISGQAVGRTGEVSYMFGEKLINVIAEGEPLRLGETIMFPTALLIHDVLLPIGMAEPADPLTKVFGNAMSPLREKRRDVDLLTVQEQAVYLGTGLDSLPVPSAPRYLDALAHVCRRMGWDPAGFDAFRCRVEYPVLHSLVSIDFPGELPRLV